MAKNNNLKKALKEIKKDLTEKDKPLIKKPDLKNGVKKDLNKNIPTKKFDLKNEIKEVKKDLTKKNKQGFDEAEIETKDETTLLGKGTKKTEKGFDEADIEGVDETNLLKKRPFSEKIQDWKDFDKFEAQAAVQETKIDNAKPVSPQKGKLKDAIKQIRQELQHDLGFHEMRGTSSLKPDTFTLKDQKEILKQRKPVEKVLDGVELGVKRKTKIYLQTGVPGFDDLFERGIPIGSSILMAGGAGSGKTLMCLQILNHACKQGKKCLYMSFEESEERLREHMNDFGWDFAKYEKNKLLYIKRFNPFDITRSVDALLEKAKGELLIDIDPVILPSGFQPDIIVVDSLTAIASAFTGLREASYRIYIEQLFRFLEHINATSFLITETEQMPTIFSQTGVEEFLADGVIVLYKIKRNSVRENAIEVLKLRGAGHQKKIVAMQITSEGVVIYPEQEVYVSTDKSN